MAKIVLISCAVKKAGFSCAAKDMYMGSYFKNSLIYAKSLKPDKIFILSAKHGVISPNDIIEPYNVMLIKSIGFNKSSETTVLSKDELRAWHLKVFADLQTLTDVENDLFVFIAGNAYTNYIRGKLKNIEEPLKGLKFGPRRSKLIKLNKLNNLTNLTNKVL